MGGSRHLEEAPARPNPNPPSPAPAPAAPPFPPPAAPPAPPPAPPLERRPGITDPSPMRKLVLDPPEANVVLSPFAPPPRRTTDPLGSSVPLPKRPPIGQTVALTVWQNGLSLGDRFYPTNPQAAIDAIQKGTLPPLADLPGGPMDLALTDRRTTPYAA
jgi:hypothetical protein